MTESAPTLASEIERKAFETIEKLHNDYVGGKINGAQFAYGRDILWSAVAGLAGTDFTIAMEMLEEVAEAPVTRTYMLHPNGRAVRLHDPHDGTITITSFQPGDKPTTITKDFRDATRPLDRVRDCRVQFCAQLLKAGFTHI